MCFDTAPPETSIAGVDGCRSGWLCVLATTAPRALVLDRVEVHSHLDQLLEATRDCRAVCVDMPVGLSADGLRRADFEARRFVGPRRSSVFPPPPRALLTAGDDYWALNALARRTRAGLSRQTYNLLPKMREADAVLTPAMQHRVRESHPEVSFCALKGGFLQHAKRTRDGRQERLALLTAVYGPGAEEWRPPPGAAFDDLYDAAVLAWTAARVASGDCVTLPATPEYDARGLRMEIVY